MDLREPEPIYTYFWVVVLKDGRTAIPQFDLTTGKENRWEAIDRDQISKAMWYPFSEEFAHTVALANGILTLATNNPVLSIDVPDGCRPIVYRPHDITRYDFYQCKTCGTKIFWDGSGDLHCPNCFAQNEWYCKQCKVVVDKPLFLKNGEVRCPYCAERGEPYGLNRVVMLDLMTGLSHEVRYCLGIEGQGVKEWNDRGEEVEQL